MHATRRGPAPRHAHALVDLPARARIAVVSDTHARPHPRLVERLRALAPALVLHAGDIGSRAVLDALGAVAPVRWVRGNVDERGADMPDDLTLELRSPIGTTLTVLLTHVALADTKLRADVLRAARDARAEVVVCGHSHLPLALRSGDVTVFNPGSAGPRRFHLPIVFGVMELSERGLSLAHIDCETGEAWRPPRVGS